jgi:RimJ/RimL family protein N-acetyltransferase
MRHFYESDAPSLLEMFQESEVTPLWLTPDLELSDSLRRIRRYQALWSEPGKGGWALEHPETGRLLGFCTLHGIDEVSELNLGFFLSKSHRGRGIMTEAARRAISFAASEWRADTVAGLTDPQNAACISVLKRCEMGYDRDVFQQDKRRVVYLKRL